MSAYDFCGDDIGEIFPCEGAERYLEKMVAMFKIVDIANKIVEMLVSIGNLKGINFD